MRRVYGGSRDVVDWVSGSSTGSRYDPGIFWDSIGKGDS